MFLEGEERRDVLAVMISRDWRGGMDWIHGSFIFILFVCVRVCVCVFGQLRRLFSYYSDSCIDFIDYS
mgnify:CR=1 FL=1